MLVVVSAEIIMDEIESDSFDLLCTSLVSWDDRGEKVFGPWRQDVSADEVDELALRVLKHVSLSGYLTSSCMADMVSVMSAWRLSIPKIEYTLP